MRILRRQSSTSAALGSQGEAKSTLTTAPPTQTAAAEFPSPSSSNPSAVSSTASVAVSTGSSAVPTHGAVVPSQTVVIPPSIAEPHPSSAVSSSPDTTTGKGNSTKNKTSAGVVAGATIGGLVAGAVIAAILVFFLLKKRHNRTMSRRHSRSSHKRHTKPENTSTVQTSAVGTVDEYLPQVIDDDVVKTEVSRISDHIRFHVRTYYHTNEVGIEHLNTLRLERLEKATGVSSSTLVAALVNPSTRTHVLRLFIAWTILEKVGPESPSNLLPVVLSPLASSLADDIGESTASTTLFSKWKVITGVLLQQNQGKQGIPQQTVAEVLADLDNVLGPFISAGSDGFQRLKNLEMILNKAGNLSLLLFSQPGSYRFDFTIEKSGLTVFPTLLQVVSSGAKPLVPPKVLWEKETMETGEV